MTPAEQMREAAALFAEIDVHPLQRITRKEIAAAIRSLPLPDDPRDAEIAAAHKMIRILQRQLDEAEPHRAEILRGRDELALRVAEQGAEIERLRERAGETRLCVVCGRTVDAKLYKPGDAVEGCPSSEVCTLDMTAQEAVVHWRQVAHDRFAEIAALRAEVGRLKAGMPFALYHPDDFALKAFADVMITKLAISRAKGRSGWERCAVDDLWAMLREHVAKGDPVDVANLAMMIWHNQLLASALKEASAPILKEPSHD